MQHVQERVVVRSLTTRASSVLGTVTKELASVFLVTGEIRPLTLSVAFTIHRGRLVDIDRDLAAPATQRIQMPR